GELARGRKQAVAAEQGRVYAEGLFRFQTAGGSGWAASVLGAKLPSPSRSRTPFAGQDHRHPTSRRTASSVLSGRITLAPPSVLAIIPLGSIEDRLIRRPSHASVQTRHKLSKIQIATSKWKLASAQSI